jgi:hypothetical protein
MALIKLNNQSLTAVTSAGLPSGSVLQVVQGTVDAQAVLSSTSFVDTGVTATITPSSTTSKILVITQHGWTHYQTGNVVTTFYLNVLRGSTSIGSKAGTQGGAASSTNYFYGALDGTLNILDSPATTSAVTYKTQVRSGSTANNVEMKISNGSGLSSITLMEIAG